MVCLKIVSCEAGPHRKKGLTSKTDASLDSPGNHKITPLKAAESAISVLLSSFKEMRMEVEGLEKKAERETRAEHMLNVGMKEELLGNAKLY